MSFSNKDISSFIDSDEVSEIDGIRLTKTHSVTHLVPERERDFRRTASVKAFSKASFMLPEITNTKAKIAKQRSMSRDRSEDDASESIDSEIHKYLLESMSQEESETQSMGGTVRRRKSKRVKKRKPETPKSSASNYKTEIGKEINELSERSEQSSPILRPITKNSKDTSKSKNSKDASNSKNSKNTKNSKDTFDKDSLEPHSREEIAEMTEGFIVVPKKDWGNLEPSDCIKWVNSDGRCVTREWYYWYHKKSQATGLPFFYVGMYPTRADAPWQITRSVFWHKVKAIYKKEDPITKLLKLAIDKRQEHIADLATFLKLKFGDEFEIFMRNREAYRMKLERDQEIMDKMKALAKQKAADANAEKIKAEKTEVAKAKKETFASESKPSKPSKSSKSSKPSKPSKTPVPKSPTVEKKKPSSKPKVSAAKETAKKSIFKSTK